MRGAREQEDDPDEDCEQIAREIGPKTDAIPRTSASSPIQMDAGSVGDTGLE